MKRIKLFKEEKKMSYLGEEIKKLGFELMRLPHIKIREELEKVTNKIK